MLLELHDALTILLYDKGRIPRAEVDISFEMPTREWVESLVRPTISIFLFDIEENTDLRHTNMQPGRIFSERDKKEVGVHRMPPRRFDLRYMVSAPNTVIEHEHLLLWRVLATLLRHTELPIDVLERTLRAALIREEQLKPGEPLEIPHIEKEPTPTDPQPKEKELTLADLNAFVKTLTLNDGPKAALDALTLEPPIATRIVKAGDGTRLSDLWGAMDLPPRPTLFYTVTVPIDLGIQYEAPLIFEMVTRFPKPSDELRDGFGDRSDQRATRADPDAGDARRHERAIHGFVRDRRGYPITGATIVIEGRPPITTDRAGYFLITKVDKGDLKATITRRGGRPLAIILTIPSDSYDIELD